MEALNALARNLSTEGLYLPYISHETLNLSAGTGTYTVGSGTGFNLNTNPFPTQVQGGFLSQSGQDSLLEMVDRSTYGSLSNKTTTGPPSLVYFEATASASGNVYFYPVPDVSGTATLNLQKPFAGWASLTSDIGLPGEYEDVFRWNLAERIAPEYGVPLQQMVAISKFAKDTLMRVTYSHAPQSLVIGPQRRTLVG